MHMPVLLNEVIEWLNVKPGAKIIDATLNGGGHTFGLLEKYSDLKILGIEWDPSIFEEVKFKIQKLVPSFSRDSKFKDNVILVNDSYVNLKNIAKQNNFYPDGIIFDLGLSSWHYEESGRGFSFRRDEILDMRFNPKRTQTTAADMVNNSDPRELERIISEYGEEKFARQITQEIVKARKVKPVIRTFDLVAAIDRAVPQWYKRRKIHFATKTFQALRVAVNDELKNVREGIQAAIEVLNPGGRLVAISFQGLEDKIVKEIFRKNIKEGTIIQPVKGTIKPTWAEVKSNPRARSAKMKVAEKIEFRN